MDTEPFQYLIAIGMILTILVVMKFAFDMAHRRMVHPGGRIDPGPSRKDETERLWNRHVDALNDLKREYSTFETDPWSAFRRPLLADVTEPQTAAFHDAFRRAQDLQADTAPASRRLVDEFGDAVHNALTAWKIADRHARKVAVPTTTDSERRRLRQAQDALHLALDERTSPAERRAALETVERLSKGLTTLEPAARTTIVTELETAERREITQ